MQRTMVLIIIFIASGMECSQKPIYFLKSKCRFSIGGAEKQLYDSKVEISYSSTNDGTASIELMKAETFTFGLYYTPESFGHGIKGTFMVDDSPQSTSKGGKLSGGKLAIDSLICKLDFPSYSTEHFQVEWKRPPETVFNPELLPQMVLVVKTSYQLRQLSFEFFDFEVVNLPKMKTTYWIIYLCCWITQLTSITINILKLVSNPYRNASQTPRISMFVCILLDICISSVLLTFSNIEYLIFFLQFIIIILELPLGVLYSHLDTEYRDNSMKKQTCWILTTGFLLVSSTFMYSFSMLTLPFLVLLPVLATIIDNFIFAIQVFNPTYQLGIYLPKLILVWYVYYSPFTPHAGNPSCFPLVYLLPLYIMLVCVCIVQSKKDPRFFMKSVWVDGNEYLHRPRTLVYDELIKEDAFSATDMCGICLVKINPNWAFHRVDDSIDITEKEKGEEEPEKRTETGGEAIGGVEGNSQEEEGHVLNGLVSEEMKIFQITVCGHVFHKGCLETWNDRNDNCPMCRRTVIN